MSTIDALLCCIKVPFSSKTANIQSYFSGHYQDYGLNVQACCDSNCEFQEVTVAGPGGCNDIAAYRNTAMCLAINCLPVGCYAIGTATTFM